MQHQEIVRYLVEASVAPDDDEFPTWVMCEDAVRFLSASVTEDVPIHVNSPSGGPAVFVWGVLLPMERLADDYLERLLRWNLFAFKQAAIYDYKGDQPVLATRLTGFGHGILEGAEPLVFGRRFDGYLPGSERSLDVNQKLVHASGIHWIDTRNAFCRLDELGNLVSVLNVTRRDDWEIVTVSREALDLYLFATDQALVRLFEFRRYSRIAHIVGRPTAEERLQREQLIARRCLFGSPSVKAAYIRGAQVIRLSPGTPERFDEAVHGSLGRREQRDYVPFIIQDFKHDTIREWPSDPSQHGNYFVESDLPFATSPSFFRPEVLNKYKREPERFVVDQEQVKCRGSWSLSYHVNDEGQVFAYIMDLAYVPYQEQLHWKEYNEKPKGPIPASVIKTDFEGEFTDVDDPLQDIKEILRNFPVASQQGRPKEIWKPNDGSFDRTFQHVHYVHTDSPEEYVREAAALSKAVIEGLTTLTALAKHHGCYPEDPQQRGSINMLQACLEKASVDQDTVRRVILPLRQVQSDRKPAAHRSGDQPRSGVATYRALLESVRDSLGLLSDLTTTGRLNFD